MKKRRKAKPKNAELMKAVVIFDGVVNLSNVLGVSYTSISRWLYTDVKIPIKHAIAIEKLTKSKISAKNLRPDIFKYDLKH